MPQRCTRPSVLHGFSYVCSHLLIWSFYPWCHMLMASYRKLRSYNKLSSEFCVSGYPVAESVCSSLTKPESREQCTVTCPQPCKLGQWQSWSDCSHPCGPESLRTRVRRVTAWPMNGGDPCPEDTQADGEAWGTVELSLRPPWRSPCAQLIG